MDSSHPRGAWSCDAVTWRILTETQAGVLQPNICVLATSQCVQTRRSFMVSALWHHHIPQCTTFWENCSCANETWLIENVSVTFISPTLLAMKSSDDTRFTKSHSLQPSSAHRPPCPVGWTGDSVGPVANSCRWPPRLGSSASQSARWRYLTTVASSRQHWPPRRTSE